MSKQYEGVAVIVKCFHFITAAMATVAIVSNRMFGQEDFSGNRRYLYSITDDDESCQSD